MCEVNQLGEIRGSIPNKLHKELKKIALDREITLKQLIVDILERYTEEERRQKNTSGKG
jgi:predicted DNA-binding ribbon-helix-helix protein